MRKSMRERMIDRKREGRGRERERDSEREREREREERERCRKGEGVRAIQEKSYKTALRAYYTPTFYQTFQLPSLSITNKPSDYVPIPGHK